MGKNANNPRNQAGDVDNQGGKLSIAVKMTQESNGNDKFKEWRELKIDENERIYKIHFQFYFLTYFAQSVSAFIIEYGQVNTGWKG